MQAALNNLPSIRATRAGNTGAVTVVPVDADSFAVTFNSNGDVTELSGTGIRPEVQELDISSLVNVPGSDFIVSYNNESSPRLPGTATAEQIETALNALTTIQATGPANSGMVDVVAIPGEPGIFTITFNTNGDKDLIGGDALIHEIQIIDVLAVGQFSVSFGPNSTGRLDPNSSAADVEAALNALPSVIAVGGVDVEPGENTSYVVTFLGDGDQLLSSATQFEPMTVNTVTAGGANAREVQQISYLSKAYFDEDTYALANLVGALSDINEIDSNVFHWIELNGTPGFGVGDSPIDGIVMAQVFDQRTVNFTPEAKLTATGFFDNDNIL
jgi:hypothetical protein